MAENGISEAPTNLAPTNAAQPSTSPRLSRQDLIDLIKKMPLDALSDKAVQRLYNRINAFTTYKPMMLALKRKGYAVDPKKGFDLPKQVSNVLQGFLESLPPNSYQTFVNHIEGKDPNDPNAGRPRVDFPTTVGWSVLEDHLPDYIDTSVIDAIARYTGQDEKKRGVGMGEVLMSLVFDNIDKPQAKGDLKLDGGEFEVKGTPGILGALPNKIPQATADSVLNPLGIVSAEKLKYTSAEGDVRSYNLNKLSEALADAVKDGKGEAVKEAVKQLLLTSGIDAAYTTTSISLLKDWNSASAADINRVFGLANFIRYAAKEGFTRFIAIDYGSGGQGTGKYLYVQGTPEQMADDLMKNKVGFQGASLSTLWPRIVASEGGPTDSLREDYLY